MIRFALICIVCIFHLIEKAPVIVDAAFFEYDLPNRTVTICPSYSLISIECPQVPTSLSASDPRVWKSSFPKYLISIDYVRSFPLRLGYDVSSCQPDLFHSCYNYDLRYINTLCNGKAECSDLSTYQIRERSLCAFKAVTEIGYHCVPTWNVNEIETKYDICQNGSLMIDYGFIYSRNYPSKTPRLSCYTTIYVKTNHKVILYFVHGELNYDELRIESVTADGLPILNVTLNGNLTTQRLGASIHEMKITFIPSQMHAYHPTYYLLYFHTVPNCSPNTEPCLLEPSPTTTTPINLPITTSRIRIQSVGWSRVSNIWIVIPIILAYILLLLLIIVLALLFQRRRKRQKLLKDMGDINLSSRYLDTAGTTNRGNLVTPLPPANGTNTIRDRNLLRNVSYSPFAQNMERYYRESRSDFDLHHNTLNGYDNRYHASIPFRTRPAVSNELYRGYDTMNYAPGNSNRNRHRRSITKSFSDCDLCKERVANDEYQQYIDEQDNWHFQNPASSPQQRTMLKGISRSNGSIHHLPVEIIPNENMTNKRTVSFRQNPNHERFDMEKNQHKIITNDDNGQGNFTVKYYERHDEADTSFYEPREIQEISMQMNDQPNFSRYPYYHQEQRRFNGNIQ